MEMRGEGGSNLIQLTGPKILISPHVYNFGVNDN